MIAKRDRSGRVATYVAMLGWIDLIGLNWGGLLYLWFARGLRKRSNGFRIATVVLTGINVVAGIAAIAILSWRGTAGTSIRFYAFQWLSPSYWVCWGFLLTFVIVHLVPMYWLLQPATRSAFGHRAELEAGTYCANCEFNLTGNESGICPECGMKIVEPSP